MNRPEIQAKGTLAFYRCVYKNAGFWSCFSYDGLTVVFDLPDEAVRSIPEKQKSGPMVLLFHLTERAHEDLRGDVQALEDRSFEDRWAGIVHLSTLI